MRRWVVIALLLVIGGAAFAQRGWRRRREHQEQRVFPTWPVDPENPDDLFTFVRIQYESERGGWGGNWHTDWPDSDNNMSFRLQQLTSMKVNPQPKVLRLTDPTLFDYPFIYLIEPGRMTLDEQEVIALRKYLLGGGFLMVDDFWGESEWDNLAVEMARVFPDRKPVELDISHPIFHAVFDLDEKPQVPSLGHWQGSGRSYERRDSEEVHYRALFDDKGRMMAIICHNTDLGDGWEREGENHEYFKLFSEPKAYPMGINIIFYAMTH